MYLLKTSKYDDLATLYYLFISIALSLVSNACLEVGHNKTILLNYMWVATPLCDHIRMVRAHIYCKDLILLYYNIIF